MNNNFYIPPSPLINNAVSFVWQADGFTTFHVEHIIPTGIVEIIFNFSDGSPILAQVGNSQYHLPNCFINGFNRVPLQLHLPVRLTFFGIRLKPLAVKKILGIAAGEFSDMIVDMDLVDSTFRSLWHELADENHFDDRVSVLTGWMEKKLLEWQPQEKMINHFLSRDDQHNVSVTELARSLCYSPRQLSRILSEATGMNTEEILLYKKYLHAMDLIHHKDLSLTQIAYQSHFSDQSHFIKSFKMYSGMTPGAYKASKGFLKGHLYENVR